MPSRIDLPPSPTPSHSLEMEHRITGMEWESRHHEKRLTVLEKAVLGLAVCLSIIAQERLPSIAATIRGLILP